MVKKAVVVGAGGQARVLISLLKYYTEYEVIGIVDNDDSNFGENISDIIINYTLNDLEHIYASGIHYAFIAFGDNLRRKKMFIDLKGIGFHLPSLRHPSAIIEKDVIIGEGTIICLGAKICTRCTIGNNVIVNTGVIIDHESVINNNVFIAPGVNIAGRVNILDSSFIGIGSSIIEKITIGENVIVGAGSVILENITGNLIVAGAPAKVINKRN